VVGPSRVVGLGAVDVVGDRRIGQLRGGELVVDAPPGVVVEGLAAPRPPGVGAFDLAGESAPDVDPAQTAAAVVLLVALCAEEAIEVGALVWQEAGSLHVALPVADVERAMAHVEVADHEREFGVGGELWQPRLHRVEEPVLLHLLLGLGHA
jgi:hypothetical protein